MKGGMPHRAMAKQVQLISMILYFLIIFHVNFSSDFGPHNCTQIQTSWVRASKKGVLRLPSQKQNKTPCAKPSY